MYIGIYDSLSYFVTLSKEYMSFPVSGEYEIIILIGGYMSHNACGQVMIKGHNKYT